MNNELKKDITKHLKDINVKSELSPGTPRRYEPEGGVRNHNARIHRESQHAKNNKNLPFTFRKPPKPVGTLKGFECEHCGKFLSGTTKTVCFICGDCGKLVKIK